MLLNYAQFRDHSILNYKEWQTPRIHYDSWMLPYLWCCSLSAQSFVHIIICFLMLFNLGCLSVAPIYWRMEHLISTVAWDYPQMSMWSHPQRGIVGWTEDLDTEDYMGHDYALHITCVYYTLCAQCTCRSFPYWKLSKANLESNSRLLMWVGFCGCQAKMGEDYAMYMKDHAMATVFWSQLLNLRNFSDSKRRW